MKWIEIEKAKPKFGEQYLVTMGKDCAVAQLSESKTTESGVVHTFVIKEYDHDVPITPTHIALITLPGKKEVDNG